MITGTLLSGCVAAGLVAHGIFVAAQGVGTLADRVRGWRTDRLAR